MNCNRRDLLRLAGAAGATLAFGQAAAQAVDVGDAIDAALAGEHRSAANKARDRYRHPKETLEFFGLRPEMTVVEIWPGGGWYTEVLAPVLRERGKLYVAQYGSKPPFPYQQREMDTLTGKIRANPELYRAVTPTALDLFSNELEIAPPGSASSTIVGRIPRPRTRSRATATSRSSASSRSPKQRASSSRAAPTSIAIRSTRTIIPKASGRCRPISRSASASATSISRSASRTASP